MSKKEYLCDCCRVIFTEEESGKPEERATVKCPQCGSINVLNLAEHGGIYGLLRRPSFG